MKTYFNKAYLVCFLCFFAKLTSAQTYTFTNAGATGKDGPTQSQIDSSYAATNLAGDVTINTRGIQEWVVPVFGTYKIEAWGAKGGTGVYSGSTNNSGMGAYISGEFELSYGDSLKILIGQAGQNQTTHAGGGGGGGGTFVVRGNDTPLIIAGGGGGGGGRVGHHGVNASFVSSGTQTSHNTGTPGTNGQGGSGGGETWGSGGGGGFTGNGGNGGSPATGGFSFTNDGIGGSTKSTYAAIGGFGGGGGVAYSGGAGGGYSGGAGGTNGEPYPAGGGGSSFNSGANQQNSSGNNTHGKVVITLLETAFEFTNAGATGREGPTQNEINTAYQGTVLENNVNIHTQGIQEWVVPESGLYKVEVFGASGGNSSFGTGGKGTYISGNFLFEKSQLLKIIAGQVGLGDSRGGGGGGGSFVVDAVNSTLLIASGGGGGAGGYKETTVDAHLQDGKDAVTETSGTDSQMQGPGQYFTALGEAGFLGNGGKGGKSHRPGGGGAGFLSNGTVGITQSGGNPGNPGLSYSDGFIGGTGEGNIEILSGGFGGGGGSGLGGGGGGGYSGGGGGVWTGYSNSDWGHGGGGGGSYNSGSDQTNSIRLDDGNGKIIITLIGPHPSYIFTNGGAIGREGPTQSNIDSAYQGTNLENKITINARGIQEWAVPFFGQYKIEVWGASGGSSTYGTGGKGAYMSGKFILEESQLLKIISGQTGIGNIHGGGGGGGSFVVNALNSTLLIAAGGGGGAGGHQETTVNPHLQDGKDAVTGTNGTDAQTQGPGYGFTALGQGGSSGSGGTGGVSFDPGAGGAGFLTDGTMGTNTSGYHPFEGKSFSNGFLGGDGRGKPNGGFGGGGSTALAGGGGGGYSGGGGGVFTGYSNSDWGHGGGGGGSYNSGTDQNNTSGVNTGNGKVIITFLTSLIPNEPPSISQGEGPILKMTSEDTLATWSVSELNATDTDTNPSQLSWSVLTPPTNGTASVDGNGTSPQTFTYLPNANYHGNDSFSVMVSDGDANDSITINLTINPVDDPAVISGEFNHSILEEGTAFGDINATDIDGLNDGSYYSISTYPLHGNATIDPIDGNWSYIPHPNFFGDDNFTISITDDLNQSYFEIIDVFIHPVDDPAFISGDFNLSILEDGTALGDVNATDEDGLTDGSYYAISTNPAHGNATIDPIDGNWSYIPHPNFFGDDNFTISITDDLNQSYFKIIEIFVHPVDDPAIISGDFNQSILEDGTAFGDVNTTDEDGLTDGSYYAISTNPVHGNATIDPIDGNWSYIPHPNFFGNDNFTISITDDLNQSYFEIIDIFIHPVDDPAIISGYFNPTIYLNIKTSGQIFADDIDGLAEDVIFEISKSPLNGTVTIDSRDGNWTYLPNHKDFGDDRFEISVNDINGNKTFQTINLVAQINHPILRTLSPTETDSDSIILAGQLISSGGSVLQEMGFYIAKTPDFADFQKVSVEMDSNFSVQNFDANLSISSEIIYIKAFASTENGDFFGQTIRYNPYSPHKNWESHATRLEADWMESEWFGTFIPYTDNWIFHIEMGWLYINNFNPESMWIWSEEKGWVWTTRNLLPFLYSNNTSNWLYILPRELEGKRFYNYETKALE